MSANSDDPTLAPRPDTANTNCRELLDVLVAQGVDTIVLSPGSRNAPLLIAAAARESLRKHIVTDERTAGFLALGISLVSRRPVALACTSGTALYNYAPAIAEAYYQHIPLIAITADRPAQWIDQDDSQTFRQFGALEKIVKRSYDIYAETGMTSPCSNRDYASEREWYVNRVANEVVLVAKEGIPGPVHINMQFGEPLSSTIPFTEGHPRIVKTVVGSEELSLQTRRELAQELMGKRVMVVAGFMQPDARLNKALRTFASLPNVTVMAETISNLHLDGLATMVDSVLVRMNSEMREEQRPDVVISVGGALVSRMLKEYLRSCKGTEHWTLADTDLRSDCFMRLTRHIEVSPYRFFAGIAGMSLHLQRKGSRFGYPDYGESWNAIRQAARNANKEYIAGVRWSELTALQRVFTAMPPEWNLFLSNGTCIRYAQILMDKMPHACYCNRGVSGIDGTNATSLGAAIAYGGTTLLVTGDMSFAYCPEIMNLCGPDTDLRIVVINNAGGGIFRFIDTTRNLEMCEQYFCCNPGVHVRGLAAAYGWDYFSATGPETLEAGLDWLKRGRRRILEITVDSGTSADALLGYFGKR